MACALRSAQQLEADQLLENQGTPSLDDVTDAGRLGPEPSESYLQRLNMLDGVVRECIGVSRSHAGITAQTGQHFYASVLFTAMISRSVSLLILAPQTPWADKKIEHWDYSSMTGITRTLIELRVAFYYMCVERCSEDEWQFRWSLFNLHDCTSRIRLFEALDNKEQLSALHEAGNELRARLVGNPFFASIDKSMQKRLLNGQTAFLFPLEVIAERAGIDLRSFRWLYVLFSSHVHALPMSFYRIGRDEDDRGRGLPSPSEENYSALCLSMAATLLIATRDEMYRLFGTPEQTSQPPKPDVSEPQPTDSPPALTVGEEHLNEFSEAFTMRTRRTDAVAYKITLIYRPTGDEVFASDVSEGGGVELSYFDPYFWTVKLNGGPATEKALEQALAGSHASRIDYSARELLFKTA